MRKSRPRSRSTRQVTGSALLTGAVLLAVGCSSSSSSTASAGSPSSGAASGTAGASASGSPVKIFTIYTANTAAENNPETVAGIQAALIDINHHGGLNGHPLQLISCNDQYTSTQAANCARQAASSGAVAVIADQSAYGTVVDPILESEHIASIGNNVVAPQDYTLSVMHPIYAGNEGYTAGEVVALADEGLTKIGIGTLNQANALPVVDVAKTAIENATTPSGQRLTNTGTVSFPLTASNWSPYAEALLKEAAQGAPLISPPEDTTELINATRQLGGKIVFASSTQIFTPSALQALGSAGNGMLLVSPFPPVTANLPGMKHFISDFTAAGTAGIPNTAAADEDGNSIDGWLSAFVLQQLGPYIHGNITAASVISALAIAKNLSLQGLGPSFTPSNPGPKGYPRLSNATVFIMKDVNGQAVLTSDQAVSVAGALQ